jgi:hypothetical protein
VSDSKTPGPFIIIISLFLFSSSSSSPHTVFILFSPDIVRMYIFSQFSPHRTAKVALRQNKKEPLVKRRGFFK